MPSPPAATGSSDALEEMLGRPVDFITFNALETSAHLRLREHILHDLEML